MSGKYSLSSPSLLISTYSQKGWRVGSISCDNSIYGCSVRLDTLEERLKHKELCEHEPNSIIKCSECETQLKRSELKHHNCIRVMKSSLKDLQKLMNKLEEKINQQSIEMNRLKQQLNELKSTQHSFDSINTKGLNKEFVEQEIFMNASENLEQSHDLSSSEVPSNEKKTLNRESISSKSGRVLPTSYAKNPNSSNSYTEDEIDFGMYGSQKYKYLSQLSRDQTISPVIKSDSNLQSIEIDYNKKNKEKLIDIKRDDNLNKKCPVVRLRSWSVRNDV